MVAEIAREEKAPELAIEATIALGGTARRSGDGGRSAEGYAEAAHLADRDPHPVVRLASCVDKAAPEVVATALAHCNSDPAYVKRPTVDSAGQPVYRD